MVENVEEISGIMRENFGYRFLLLQEVKSQKKGGADAFVNNGSIVKKMEGYLNNIYFVLKKDSLTNSVELEFYPQNNEFESDDMENFINIISKNVVGKDFLINYLDKNYLRTVQWSGDKNHTKECILKFFNKYIRCQIKEWKFNETFGLRLKEMFSQYLQRTVKAKNSVTR